MSEKSKFPLLSIAVFIAVCIACPSPTRAGVPVVDSSRLRVTDVTPRSFSVIWPSSEASTSDLNVFLDADGTEPAPDAVIISQPTQSGDSSIAQAAEDDGSMKVRVENLEPDTTYYFQTVTTSKSTVETTLYPTAGPFLQAQTEINVLKAAPDASPFDNVLIFNPGWGYQAGLILLNIEGASSPVSAFINDAVPPGMNSTLFNLNNVFSSTTGESLSLSGGLRTDITIFTGPQELNFVNTGGWEALNKTTPAQTTSNLMRFRFSSPRGDLNGDDNRDSIDLDLIRAMALGESPATQSADLIPFFQDGVINSRDLQKEVNITGACP